MNRLKVKKGKKKIIAILFIAVITIFLVFSSIVLANFNLQSKNSHLETNITQKNDEMMQYEENIVQLEGDLLLQYEENNRLYNETIRLIEAVSNRDLTITERDRTIIGLYNDLRLLDQDLQEIKSKAEFPPMPEVIGEISETVLYSFLTGFADNDTYIYLCDRTYALTILSELERFLEWDITDEFSYEADVFDCDDFAFRLNGQITIPGWSDLCFGVIRSPSVNGNGSHVYNVFVTEEEGELVLYSVEPQNDLVQRITSMEGISLFIFS